MAKKRIDPKLPIPKAGVDRAATPDTYDDRLLRRLNELFLERDGGGVQLLDEGVLLGEADALNFVGGTVTASLSSTLGTITIDSSTAISGIVLKDEGVTQGTVTSLDFVGATVVASAIGAAGTITITASGSTVDTLSVTASEALAQGNLVNVWSSGGSFRVRKADATLGAGYEAHGWVDAAVLNTATATIRFLGKNTYSSGLTPGPVFLGTAGAATSTPPSTAGYLSQEVGASESSSSFAFEWHPDILIATTGSPSAGPTLQSDVFLANGTYTPKTGVTGVWLNMYSGGGAGAGGNTGAGHGGGGGAAGEFCEGFQVDVSGAVSVVVGAGGIAGAAGAAGGTGGNSSFGSYVVIGGGGGATVNGGTGGGLRGAAGNTGNGTAGTAESPSFYGGSSGGGQGVGGGAGTGGGSAGRLTGGAAGSGVSGGGGGGATPIGLGGGGGATGLNNGVAAGANTGGGGGGGGGNGGAATTGGTGGTGKVVVFYVA